MMATFRDREHFEAMTPHVIIRQIVNRDCHVSMSYRDVVRYCRAQVRPGSLTRETSRYLTWSAITVHRENRELYAAVMAGRLGR